MRAVVSLVVVAVMMALFHHLTAGGLLEARATLALGFLLIAAQLGADIVSQWRLPRLTGYLVTGQVPGDQAVHTATDVPLSAYGRGASLFSGVIDNTDVFFKLMQAMMLRQ